MKKSKPIIFHLPIFGELGDYIERGQCIIVERGLHPNLFEMTGNRSSHGNEFLIFTLRNPTHSQRRAYKRAMRNEMMYCRRTKLRRHGLRHRPTGRDRRKKRLQTMRIIQALTPLQAFEHYQGLLENKNFSRQTYDDISHSEELHWLLRYHPNVKKRFNNLKAFL